MDRLREQERPTSTRHATIASRVRIVGGSTNFQERARRRSTRGALLAGSGVLLLALSIVATETLGEGAAWLGGTAAFFGLGAILVGTLRLFAARREGERAAAEQPLVARLRNALDARYVYLRRVIVPGHRVEAEGLLLGPHGALVLAMRALAGDLRVQGHDWFRLDAAGAEHPLDRSPSWELMRPLRSIERVLQEHGLGDVPVQGAVVLVEGRLVAADRPGTAIVPLDRIAQYLDYLRSQQAISERQLARLIELFEPHASGG